MLPIILEQSLDKRSLWLSDLFHLANTHDFYCIIHIADIQNNVYINGHEHDCVSF